MDTIKKNIVGKMEHLPEKFKKTRALYGPRGFDSYPVICLSFPLIRAIPVVCASGVVKMYCCAALIAFEMSPVSKMGCTKLVIRALLEVVNLELVRRRDNSLTITIDWTLSTEDGQYEK